MASKTVHTQLPDGVTLEMLKDNWNTCTTDYARAIRRAYILDATDRGRLWEAVKATFPKYQILPDTNHVAFVKNNLLASIYTVGKSASLFPTTKDDMAAVFDINLALEHNWGLMNVGYYQMLAGERAALLNMGITQVGWAKTLSSSGVFAEGRPVLKNVDPMKFMRDPYAPDLDNAAYCMTWDMLNASVLKANPLYAGVIDGAIDRMKNAGNTVPMEQAGDRPLFAQANSARGYFKLVTHWVRRGDQVHEIHTLDNEEVLYVKKDIRPSRFPFAVLYCNNPVGDLMGTSECAKIFANSFAYNLINSILLTADYKNQRPPRFISAAAMLNIASFVAHGNEADYTFIVQGDATKAVHYHQFPLPSQNAQTIMAKLGMDIQQVTGVSDRYTGKSTGSILTTGGVEAALDQATLIDTYKIVNYENYTKQLTELIFATLMEFSPKRSYVIRAKQPNKYIQLDIDFPKLPKDTLYLYEMNISSELPKNKARIAQTANILMEKQLQYSQNGGKVQFITPEEWLMMQDLPNKELMQERMGIQRGADYTEKVSRILFGFAQLVKNGVPPEDAVAAVAQDLEQSEQPQGGGQPQLMEENPPPPPEMPLDLGGPPDEQTF